MKKLRNLFLLSAVFFSLSMSALAETNLKMQENLVLTDTLFDDAYFLLGNGNIESDVYGDLYIAGGTVTINGKISEDLVVAGGSITVLGDVGGDLRIIGGQTAVYGKVGDDLVVVGGKVDIGKEAILRGSLIATAGIVTLDGEVQEDIRGVLGMLLLNGKVNKNVTVTIEDTLNISEKAFIGGNLSYSALVEATIPEGVIKGAVSFNKFERDSVIQGLTYWFFVQKLISFGGGLILLLLFVSLMPKGLTMMAEQTRQNVFKSFGIGLLTMIAGVVGSILLMITVIGIPLAMIILASLLIIFFLTQVFVAVWLGSYVVNYKKTKRVKLFFVTSLSLLVYHLIGLIPFAGWALNLVLFLAGVGGMYMMKTEYWKFLRKKGML